MTRSEMINFLKENPYVKVTHSLFGSDEYIYSKEDGKVYEENGYLFEDWHSLYHDGLRMRTGGEWEDGWSLFDENNTDIKKEV